MALTYKTDVITLNAANTDFTILTASASSTIVKNITWIHDDHNTNVILSITKSGGSKISIGEYVATANTSTKIWTDVLPLGANDVLHLQSDHISGSDVGYCVISYVEDTASVAGQSIAVHTDVSISGITDGQVLEWNNSTTQFEPATVSGGATDTDGLTEGSTNLYFTDARVAANSAVAANTAKVSGIANVNADTAPQLGGTLDVNGNELQSNSDFIVRVDADNNTSNSKFVVKNGAGNEAFSVNEEGTNISITGADNNIKIGNLDGGLSSFNGISLNNNLTYPGIVGFAGGSNNNDNFFCFGVVLDFRPDGVAGGLRMVKDSSGNAMVTINKGDSSTAPTTHTLYVGGNGKFDGNLDAAAGVDVTGNITVTGTVDGIDVGVDVAANTAKVGYTNSAVDARIVLARSPYAYDELVTDRNITMSSDVSQSTNKICDVLGDALAAKDNANAKKLLGWHTGNGTVVLQGFIDLNASLTATAGQALWLGASGSLSASAPTTTDEYARVVGHYIGIGQGGEVMVYFNPSSDWIQID